MLSQVLLQNNYRCVFPNLLHGQDAKFEESTYLDTRGDKLKTVRGAWQPFFFSGRRAPAPPLCSFHAQTFCNGDAHKDRKSQWNKSGSCLYAVSPHAQSCPRHSYVRIYERSIRSPKHTPAQTTALCTIT